MIVTTQLVLDTRRPFGRSSTAAIDPPAHAIAV